MRGLGVRQCLAFCMCCGPRVQWQSVRWPDNSSFEGLVKDDKCHVRGVFKYGNGDRYEGEFEDNNMSGFGVYVWAQEGSVYRGQWRNSMMDGCGVKISKSPGGYLAEEGTFLNDEWVGDVMGCSIEQAREAAAEADTAAQMARVFEQLGDGGASSGAAIEAQEAAAAAAATARQAKSRRHQRQRTSAEVLSPAAPEAALAAGSTLPAPSNKKEPSRVQQVAQGVQSAASQTAAKAKQVAAEASQRAGHTARQATSRMQGVLQQAAAETQVVAERAQHAAQRLIKAGQQRLQQRPS